MSDIIDISSAKRDGTTNGVVVTGKAAQMGDDPNDAPGHDNVPLYGVLGITALPWPADDRGAAQGIVDEDQRPAVITSIRDLRAAGVIEELGPGETAIHSTGPDFDSRVFLKKQLAAVMVGDDCAIVMDRENKRFSVSCFGLHFEMSEENGIVMSTGGATTQMKDSLQSLMGTIVLGGRTPVFPVAQMMTPILIGVAPLSPIAGIAPAAGVFIGV